MIAWLGRGTIFADIQSKERKGGKNIINAET